MAEEKEWSTISPCARIFKSVGARIAVMNDVANSGGTLFEGPFEYEQDPTLMALKRLPILKAGVADPDLFYTRKETQTYVSRLKSQHCNIVCKVFSIPDLADDGEDAHLLESHEVEARYLKLLSFLMAHRLIDSCTLPLATIVCSKAEVGASGLLGASMVWFPERHSRVQERYMVLFAEAADCSLPHMLAGMVSDLAYSRPLACYVTKVVLFQITYTLATIHRVFPSFTHLDLHLSNWLVQRIDVTALRIELGLSPEHPLVVEYSLHGKKWHVDLDRAPFRVLMWDMFYSNVSPRDASVYGLQRVQPRCRVYGPNRDLPRSRSNQFVDLCKTVDTFMWVAKRCGKQEDTNAWDELDPEVRQFCERVVPPHLQVAELDSKVPVQRKLKRERQGVIHGELLHTSPSLVLENDPFFTSLECKRADRHLDPVYRLKGDRRLAIGPEDIPLLFTPAQSSSSEPRSQQ
jgi:hypothetical protein